MTDDPETKSMPPSDGSSVPPEPSSFQLNPGDRVGNYVIREQIGEGGFAIVYAAEQEKPAVDEAADAAKARHHNTDRDESPAGARRRARST